MGWKIFFFSVAQWPSWGLGYFIVEVFVDHTQTHTPGRTPLNEWSARHRGRHTRHTTLRENKRSCPQWDLNPQSEESASDICLSLHGYQDQQTRIIGCLEMSDTSLPGK